ncbi:MAG: hypothetical protein ACE15C_08765 [Phycisphaerae bacterium]
MKVWTKLAVAVAGLAVCVSVSGLVFANGGPFVIKYPSGDPAAKGVLARLEPDLKPGKEERLRVVKEDLKITFDEARLGTDQTPLAKVSAGYTIENPTDQEIQVDFGFPILRGIYMSPFSMMPTPDAVVRVGTTHVRPTIISTSTIYGLIRQKARETIDKAVAADADLTKLCAAVKAGPDDENAQSALIAYLTRTLSSKATAVKWKDGDAALMAAYAGLDVGAAVKTFPFDASSWGTRDAEMRKIAVANLGPLSAIGDQKATQLFAHLANCFDPKSASAYEAIFAAWGGDVKEQSVDLATGKVRPREMRIDAEGVKKELTKWNAHGSDPTIYARVEYLDENAKITDAEKNSCRTILKYLPVTFTFAPMNLLHYQAKFPAKSTVVLTVTYSQYAYRDTGTPASYQLAYVVHPASLWKEFGPINLEVVVPQGVAMKSSVECAKDAPPPPLEAQAQAVRQAGIVAVPPKPPGPGGVPVETYRAVLKDKTGELFVGIDADSWDKAVKPAVAPTPAPPAAKPLARNAGK